MKKVSCRFIEKGNIWTGILIFETCIYERLNKVFEICDLIWLTLTYYVCIEKNKIYEEIRHGIIWEWDKRILAREEPETKILPAIPTPLGPFCPPPLDENVPR